MATVETIYLGELRTEATHVQSGSKILTRRADRQSRKGRGFLADRSGSRSIGQLHDDADGHRGPDARRRHSRDPPEHHQGNECRSAPHRRDNNRHTFSGRDGSESAHRTGTGGGYLPGSPLAASRLQANGPLSLRRISLRRQRRHVAENHRTARHRAMRVIVVSL